MQSWKEKILPNNVVAGLGVRGLTFFECVKARRLIVGTRNLYDPASHVHDREHP